MNETVNEYTCWRSIDYKPALKEISVAKLAPYLHVGQRALEVGCHSGRTAMWLANRGIDVLGVDINSKAVVQARASAELSNSKAHFLEGDFLAQRNLGTFDFVLMIRVLTCFSDLEAWRALLAGAYACVAPGGYIYIQILSSHRNMRSTGGDMQKVRGRVGGRAILRFPIEKVERYSLRIITRSKRFGKS